MFFWGKKALAYAHTAYTVCTYNLSIYLSLPLSLSMSLSMSLSAYLYITSSEPYTLVLNLINNIPKAHAENVLKWNPNVLITFFKVSTPLLFACRYDNVFYILLFYFACRLVFVYVTTPYISTTLYVLEPMFLNENRVLCALQCSPVFATAASLHLPRNVTSLQPVQTYMHACLFGCFCQGATPTPASNG